MSCEAAAPPANDDFRLDENAAHTYPSEWWQTSFTQAVGSIGHTALVLTPWSSPVPLRRACVTFTAVLHFCTREALSLASPHCDDRALELPQVVPLGDLLDLADAGQAFRLHERRRERGLPPGPD